MAPTSMMTKFLLLVSIWLVMVVAVFGDSVNEFSDAIDDRALLERAAYAEAGLLARDSQLTVTVTETVCATQGSGIPHTTLIPVPLPSTVALTSVPCETESGHTTANAPSQPPTMPTVGYSSRSTVAIIPSSTIVASSPPSGSTQVGISPTGATFPSSSPVTSAASSHSVSSQATGSASTSRAPSSSHSSTAPPLSNDANAQGGTQGTLLVLGLTFAGFMAI